MPDSLVWGLILLAFIWLGALSYYWYRLVRHYQMLTEGVSKKNLEFVLENLKKELDLSKKQISHLISRCDTIEKNEVFHIQKVGLLRFNPFKDTGGDQSFILSLGDANNTGVLITVLHSRSGVRWYVKRFKDGKGVDNELSEEERKTLREAVG